MPTYADLYNERLLALGQSGPSNPVRLTISRGDYIWDAQLSRFRYEEQWEEEHLMEHDELENDSLLAPPSHSDVHSRGSSPPTLDALQLTMHHRPSDSFVHSPSLWVLDTNTLMSCLELLKALFAALLTRNVTYAAAQPSQPSTAATRPSPIKLVIPYVVVSELDGLKITCRKNESGQPVASQAREANHWLLSALQKQKRVPIDQAGTNLAEDLWPLFVQPSKHYNRAKRSRCDGSRWYTDDALSCDDEIVKFCADLNSQTPANVRFCSDDVNARTKAELDGIDSLGMRELANALKLGFKQVQNSERKWTLVAESLIEQWEYQIGDSQLRQHNDHHYQGQQSIDQNADQHAWQSATILPSNPIRQHNDAYTQPLHAPHPSPPIANTTPNASTVGEIVEVDMGMEEQQLPSGQTPTPIPVMSVCPVRPTLLSFSSADGRGTSDSIHSPHNSKQTSRSRTIDPRATSSRHQIAASAASATPDLQPAQSEVLNPQIEWKDLVQQLGSSPRASNKHRTGRW